jgi:ABC-type uncharacterized transport system involved in gliding motility auxiliary subunit
MNNKKHCFFTLVKHELFNYAITSATYIGAGIFLLALAGNFYFARNFFIQGRGSTDVRYFFLFIPYISILFIPVLTMNLWQSGDEIVDSIPLENFLKVFAKWLASFLLFFVCTLVSLVIPFLVIFFGDLDLSRILCGFFCILLFSAVSLALGQWISLVTKNSISSFILTAVSLAIFNSIHLLPMLFHIPNFLLKICNFFSFAWHFDAASKGIIDTRDVLFFVFVTIFFLLQCSWLCEKKLHNLQSNLPRKKIFKNFILSSNFLLLVLLINSQIFYTRIDTTSEKQFSLAPITKELLQNLPANLDITYYVSNNLRNLYPQIRDVQDLLNECTSFSSSVNLSLVNPKTEDIQQRIKKAGLQTQQIQVTEKNETAVTEVFSGLILECGTKTQIIPFVLSTATFEYQIDSALQYFISGVNRAVYILYGGSETFEDEYPYVQSWLEESGFNSLTVTAEQISDTQKIDLRFPLLVLGNSKITTNGAAAIERFVMAGGKACFAVSTITADKKSWTITPVNANPLIEMLDHWGFSIKTALVQDISNYKITMKSQDTNDSQYINYPFWIVTRKQNVATNSPITKFFTGLEFYWPNPIELFSTDILKIQPIVKTTANAWLQLPVVDNESLFSTDPFDKNNQVINNETQNSYTLVAAATGKVLGWSMVGNGENTRVIVSSNQYFPSDMVGYTNSSYNLDFLVNCLLWLSNEDPLLQVKAKGNINTTLYKITDNAKFGYAEKMVLVFLTLWYVIIIGGIALVIFLWRRKKIEFYKKDSYLE